MYLQQHGIQEEATCRVDSIWGCTIGDKGNDNDTANTSTVSSSIKVDTIETEDTGAVSSIVRACDTDVLHQNKIDCLDLYKIPNELI